MSVQMNQYMCYGYLFPYKESIKALENSYGDDVEDFLDNYSDSAFKSEITEVNGLSLILDGMSGDYIFFGKIFNKSDEGEPLQSMAVPKVSSKTKKIVDLQKEEIFGDKLETKPGIILLTHYR